MRNGVHSSPPFYLCLLLAACGGGGGGSAPAPPSPPTPTTSTYTVGGSVTGLTGSGLILQNNAGNNLTITSNGTFTFASSMATGANYAVTVLTQPTNQPQFCTVTNASGTVASSNVTSVSVNCVAVLFRPVTASLQMPRALHGATLLANGRILLTGGVINAALVATDTAEIFDPATNTSTAVTARMSTLRNQHTATMLQNGLVLIAGGSNDGNGDGMDTAELFNPATQAFTTLTARLTTPRGGHAAALLANGQVLLSGGFSNSSVHHNSAELYNPATQTFTATPATLAVRRAGHTATTLSNGRVVIIGGDGTTTTEIYDPATNAFTTVASPLSVIREWPSAVLLPSGQVLIAGGSSSASSAMLTTLASAEMFNPANNGFSSIAATLSTSRLGHSGTLLSNGNTVVIGGGSGTNSAPQILNSVEVYGP